MAHTRYPHWIHGPHGTAPSGTTLQGDNEIPQLPSFVVKDAKTVMKPSEDKGPSVFNKSRKQENGVSKSQGQVKLDSNQNIGPNQGKTPRVNGALHTNDITPLSNRSSIQSRATLKSPGMISLHEYDNDDVPPQLKTPKTNVISVLSGAKHVNKKTGKKETQNNHKRVSADLSSKKLTNKKTKPVKNKSTQKLQKSATSVSLDNKAGIFSFDTPDAPDTEEGGDDIQDGIAYDDDCQVLREMGYNSGANDVVVDIEWMYGAFAKAKENEENSRSKLVVENGVESKKSQDTQFAGTGDTQSNKTESTPNPGTEDTVSLETEDDTEEEDEEEEDTEEECEEEEDEETTNINAHHILDVNSMDTAMSIAYSSNERDPDKMHITFHRPLTPVAE